MIIPRFDNQENFDNYCNTALQALGSGQYVAIETNVQGENILSPKERLNLLQRFIRYLCPCFYRNRQFDTISNFMLTLFETNHEFLKGHSVQLMQLSGRWSRRSPEVSRRINGIVQEARILEADVKQIQENAQQDRKTAAAERAQAIEDVERAQQDLENFRNHKDAIIQCIQEESKTAAAADKAKNSIDLTTKPAQFNLSVIDKLPYDCTIVCQNGEKVQTHSAFLKRFDYFQTIPSTLLNQTPQGLESEQKESQETCYDWSKKDGFPGFSEATTKHFLHYVYTDELLNLSFEDLCNLYILGNHLCIEGMQALCTRSLQNAFKKKPSLNFFVDAILKPPVQSPVLDDFFAQMFIWYMTWAHYTIKAKLSEETKTQLFSHIKQCYEQCRGTNDENPATLENVIVANGLVIEAENKEAESKEETNLQKWTLMNEDPASIYATFLGSLYEYGIGTLKNAEIGFDLYAFAAKRQYAPALHLMSFYLLHPDKRLYPLKNKKNKIAYRLACQADKMNYVPAAAVVIFCQVNGIGCTKSRPLFKSSDFNDPMFLFQYGRVLSHNNPNNNDYCHKAAQMGYPAAMYCFAKALQKNKQIPKAICWAIQAKEAGQPKGEALLNELLALPR